MELSEITNDEIILFQQKSYTIFDCVILTVITPILVFLLYDNVSFLSAVFFSLLIFPILFYLLRNMEIVFDKKNRVVWRTFPLLGSFKLIDFDNIYSIELWHPGLIDIRFLNKNKAFCVIRRKANPFGIKITILSRLNRKKENFKQFETQTLPLLRACIEKKQTDTGKAKRTMSAFYMLKEKEKDIFSIFSFRLKLMLLYGFVLFIGLSFLADLIKNGYHKPFDLYSLVFIPLGLFLQLRNTQKIQFDKRNKLFTVSYLFDARKKQYAFEDFFQFKVVQYTTGFVFTRTELNMVLADNKTITVASFSNQKKVEMLQREILEVLYQQ